jgi:hypothetical protein
VKNLDLSLDIVNDWNFLKLLNFILI